jgi:hypothetical protein
MDYNFLRNITLVDTGRLRAPKEKNPTGLAVRIFSTGEVYPSQELVNKYNLEYLKKGVESNFGIDIVDSINWTPTATFPRMILFGFTPKKEAKVDLFGSCRWDDNDLPKSTVTSQGSKSEVLLDLVRAMGYLNDDQKYVDLQLVEEFPIKTENGISYIPKVMERGDKKGEQTYERRENVTFYPVNTPENLKAMKEQATVNSNATTSQNVEIQTPALGV